MHNEVTANLLNFILEGTSRPTTLTETTHLPLTENRQPESKDDNDLNAQNECTKVCGGKHEMKWILERNYSDDYVYNHANLPKIVFLLDFSIEIVDPSI